MAGKNTHSSYWAEYSGLQEFKHRLIEEYLKGWFPKLGHWAGRIVYFDTHAGRGRHAQGNLGSPLIALQTFMNHSSRDRILRSSEVVFYFIERNKANYDALCGELKSFQDLPRGIKVYPVLEDCEKVLEEILDHLESTGASIAPSFFFVDPFGFSLPMTLLRRIIQFERVELLINVMWRELDMAICQRGKVSRLKQRLDDFFGSDDWLSIADISGSENRADAAVGLLARSLGAKWSTYLKMRIKRRTRYILLHLTNHDAGRDLIKESIWELCPDGSYIANADTPNQLLLLQPKPDFRPLERWLYERLSQGPRRWSYLERELRATIWLPKHARSLLRDWRRNGMIIAEDYGSRFSFKDNPQFRLAEK